ncbi:MAG: oxidoreductase [Promethearchaeota archaeon]
MLKEKVVVVTGGAGLLGKVFCEGIIKNNGIPIIADINENPGKQLEEELKIKYQTENVLFQVLDITSKESINFLIELVNNKYGKIDALVNNDYPRNKNYGRVFFEVEYRDFCENVNLHLGRYFLTSQLYAKFFAKQGFGNIMNIASIYGVIAPRFEIYQGTKMTTPVEYAVIKSGVIHMTKYLAKYLKGSNIRVNVISPGGIFDNQPESFLKAYKSYSSTKGMLDKTYITGTLLFLLSDLSKYINGQNIAVDDGLMCW